MAISFDYNSHADNARGYISGSEDIGLLGTGTNEDTDSEYSSMELLRTNTNSTRLKIKTLGIDDGSGKNPHGVKMNLDEYITLQRLKDPSTLSRSGKSISAPIENEEIPGALNELVPNYANMSPEEQAKWQKRYELLAMLAQDPQLGGDGINAMLGQGSADQIAAVEEQIQAMGEPQNDEDNGKLHQLQAQLAQLKAGGSGEYNEAVNYLKSKGMIDSQGHQNRGQIDKAAAKLGKAVVGNRIMTPLTPEEQQKYEQDYENLSGGPRVPEKQVKTEHIGKGLVRTTVTNPDGSVSATFVDGEVTLPNGQHMPMTVTGGKSGDFLKMQDLADSMSSVFADAASGSMPSGASSDTESAGEPASSADGEPSGYSGASLDNGSKTSKPKKSAAPSYGASASGDDEQSEAYPDSESDEGEDPMASNSDDGEGMDWSGSGQEVTQAGQMAPDESSPDMGDDSESDGTEPWNEGNADEEAVGSAMDDSFDPSSEGDYDMGSGDVSGAMGSDMQSPRGLSGRPMPGNAKGPSPDAFNGGKPQGPKHKGQYPGEDKMSPDDKVNTILAYVPGKYKKHVQKYLFEWLDENDQMSMDELVSTLPDEVQFAMSDRIEASGADPGTLPFQPNRAAHKNPVYGDDEEQMPAAKKPAKGKKPKKTKAPAASVDYGSDDSGMGDDNEDPMSSSSDDSEVPDYSGTGAGDDSEESGDGYDKDRAKLEKQLQSHPELSSQVMAAIGGHKYKGTNSKQAKKDYAALQQLLDDHPELAAQINDALAQAAEAAKGAGKKKKKSA